MCKIVWIQILIIKLLYLIKTSIILKNSNSFYRYRFKNRLRNFQPENGRKFKNKPGWPEKRGSYRKNKRVHEKKNTSTFYLTSSLFAGPSSYRSNWALMHDASERLCLSNYPCLLVNLYMRTEIGDFFIADTSLIISSHLYSFNLTAETTLLKRCAIAICFHNDKSIIIYCGQCVSKPTNLINKNLCKSILIYQ